VSSRSGITFEYGNSEEARPNSYNDDLSKYEKEIKNLDEIDIDKLYFSKAIEWIKNNKIKAIRLYGLKILNYFNYKVELKTQEEASVSKDIIMLLTYGLILLIFLIRLILTSTYRLDNFEKFITFLYVSNAFLLAIFIIKIRLRLPFDLLLIAIAGVFLDKIIFNRPIE